MYKEILVAANTPQGFVNYFDEYLDRDRVICLKGGSGVGKSTLLRTVIKEAQERNYTVTAVPCSSDYRSLDMVIVKELDVAILDATAPHIVEPRAYGVVGEIFNLGDFLDKEKLRKSKASILKVISDKAVMYNCLYNHLRAAQCHLSNIESIYSACISQRDLHGKAQEIIDGHCLKVISCVDGGNCFGSYIDTGALVDMSNTIAGARVVVKIDSPSSAIAKQVLKIVANYLTSHGIRYEAYRSLMTPDLLESIGLKNIFITISQNVEADWVYSIGKKEYEGDMRSNLVQIIDERSAVSSEIARACERLKAAKTMHLDVEKYYFDAMDFAALEDAKDILINSIFRG